MIGRPGPLGFLLLLSACGGEEPGDAPAGTPVPPSAPAQTASWTPPQQCPDWADPKRPEGSNCLGILPQRCGADRASGYVGHELTPRVEAALGAIAPAGVRVIGPEQAHNDDLREGRLNVFTDSDNAILSVDCF